MTLVLLTAGMMLAGTPGSGEEALAWVQTGRPVTTQPTVNLGFSVDISGDLAVAGDVGAGPDGDGVVHVFVRQAAGVWAEEATIEPVDPTSNGFGQEVALDGSTILVGDQNAGEGSSGAAYVFVRNEDGEWSHEATLTTTDEDPVRNFGNSVALDGDTAVIGDWTAGPGGLSGDGAAYVFVRDSQGEWTEQAKLFPEDEEVIAFGWDVAIDGEKILASDPGAGPEKDGAAFVFTRDEDGSWNYQAKLVSDGTVPSHSFGRSVALDDDTALVGDDGAGTFGAAYIFNRDIDEDWSLQSTLIPADPTIQGFGDPVALEDDVAVVGDDEANGGIGSVYVFRNGANGWLHESNLVPHDVLINEFGWDLAISDETILVGDRNAGLTDQGGVFVFNPLASPI